MKQRRILFASLAALVLAAATLPAQVDLNKVAKLRNPAALTDKAPERFKAQFDTSKGTFVIDVHREWAPIGADRFYNLVKNGYYDDVRFFRVIPDFMVQFGMHGNPAIGKVWSASSVRLQDDPVKQGSKRGYVVFAHAGPNTRTTQLFINFKDNSASLNRQGFAAFGEVISGMDVVDKIYSGYGERPEQARITAEGNAYLNKELPRLDYIKSATIVN
jgi:peptidyl-prolyl cis-trans isomerase A (cyclophilin A)